MRLLFDQNLSPRLPRLLADIYAGSVHVREIGLRDASDTVIWEHAKDHGFTLVSKDSDFQQRSLLHAVRQSLSGCDNCTVRTTEHLLRKHSAAIHTFGMDDTKSHLILP